MVNTNSVLSSILFSQIIDWNIKQFFSSTLINSSFELNRIGKAITRRKDQMVVEDDKRYTRITIKTNCGGVFVRDEVLGKDIKTKNQYYVKAGQLAVSKIDARNGAFGIVPPEADGAIITGNFWVYDVNPNVANIEYLILLLSSNVFVQAWQDCSNGSGNRLYLQEEKFLNYKIPMPEADVQKDLIRKYNTQLAEAKKDQDSIDNLQYQIEQYILKKLGISFKRSSFNGLIGTTYYKNLTRWDPTYLSNKIIINSNEKMIDMAAVIAHFMVDTSGKRLRINTKEDPDKKFAYIGIFLKSIKGMGPATISELLTYANPQEYVIFNKTTILCYGYLDIPDMPKYNYQYTGKKYAEVCAIAKKIAAELKKAGADDYDLLAVDYFMWDEILPLAEKKSPVSSATPEVKKPVTVKDSKSLHDEIKEKLVAIGELLGFDSRSEVKITTGAVVDAVWEAKIGNMGKAIYVFEVQSKGSIDSLILNLKKAQSNAAVQAVVAVADEEQLAKIIQESAGEIDEKSLRTWDSEDVLAVYDALVRAHESINKLALVPESF